MDQLSEGAAFAGWQPSAGKSGKGLKNKGFSMWNPLARRLLYRKTPAREIGRLEKKGETYMPLYSFTGVKVSSGTNLYLQQGKGTSNGENVFEATRFACKCTSQPPRTTYNAATNTWSPIYRISGFNPSGRHILLDGKCIYNASWQTEACDFDVSLGIDDK